MPVAEPEKYLTTFLAECEGLPADLSNWEAEWVLKEYVLLRNSPDYVTSVARGQIADSVDRF